MLTRFISNKKCSGGIMQGLSRCMLLHIHVFVALCERLNVNVKMCIYYMVLILIVCMQDLFNWYLYSDNKL